VGASQLKIIYSIDAKISQFEWMLLQEFRRLQEFGFGDISVKLFEGKVKELKCSKTIGGKDLLTN
jgi:hypothetical protein